MTEQLEVGRDGTLDYPLQDDLWLMDWYVASWGLGPVLDRDIASD